MGERGNIGYALMLIVGLDVQLAREGVNMGSSVCDRKTANLACRENIGYLAFYGWGQFFFFF